MSTYSDYEQRLLDQQSGAELDRRAKTVCSCNLANEPSADRHASYCELAHASIPRASAPQASKDQLGELWSFLRSVLSQGGDIWLDHREKSYEQYSARLDAAARERVDALAKLIAPSGETPDAQDAARYRAIRTSRVGAHGHCEIWNVAYVGRQLDEAVDAVRAVKTGSALTILKEPQ